MNTISGTSQTLPVELLSAAEAPSYAKAMTRTVKISEAKVTLSKLADEVSLGKEVIVSRAGKPVMKLVAVTALELEAANPKAKNRKLGYGRKYAPDFTWEQWEESEREMEKIWRKFGYID
jgi:antitoxin (DNA-binding transcriptional repressor) of toxin-antitoxin stability system